MRKKIVAGNWKMNKNLAEGEVLANQIINSGQLHDEVQVILFPSFIHLASLSNKSKETKVSVGSQNNHTQASGAYTGEVSASMLKSIGIEFGLVGHSERRTFNKESDDELVEKTNALLKEDIVPVFCCGEHLEQRKDNTYFDTIKSQLSVPFQLGAQDFKKIIIAYEPVWAIGTGETASSAQAQEMHAFIRKTISEKYGEEIAQNTSILYGGSCKPSNAKELFAMEDVDGGLIGGASLVAEDFIAIINSF